MVVLNELLKIRKDKALDLRNKYMADDVERNKLVDNEVNTGGIKLEFKVDGKLSIPLTD